MDGPSVFAAALSAARSDPDALVRRDGARGIVGLHELRIAAVLFSASSGGDDYTDLLHRTYQDQSSRPSGVKEFLQRRGPAPGGDGEYSLLDLALWLNYADIAEQLTSRGVACRCAWALSDWVDVEHPTWNPVGSVQVQLPRLRLLSPHLWDAAFRAGALDRGWALEVYGGDGGTGTNGEPVCTGNSDVIELSVGMFAIAVLGGRADLAQALADGGEDASQLFRRDVRALTDGAFRDLSGALFVEVVHSPRHPNLGRLRINMPAVDAALSSGVDLNGLPLDLDFITGGTWYSGVDSAMTCPRCLNDVAEDQDIFQLVGVDGTHASMLEVAVLSGDTEAACSLVERGTPTYVLSDMFTTCLSRWGICACGEFVDARLVAAPEVRATVAAAARRCELRLARRHEHQYTLALCHLMRCLPRGDGFLGHVRCVEAILEFAADPVRIAPRSLCGGHTCNAWRGVLQRGA